MAFPDLIGRALTALAQGSRSVALQDRYGPDYEQQLESRDLSNRTARANLEMVPYERASREAAILKAMSDLGADQLAGGGDLALPDLSSVGIDPAAIRAAAMGRQSERKSALEAQRQVGRESLQTMRNTGDIAEIGRRFEEIAKRDERQNSFRQQMAQAGLIAASMRQMFGEQQKDQRLDRTLGSRALDNTNEAQARAARDRDAALLRINMALSSGRMSAEQAEAEAARIERAYEDAVHSAVEALPDPFDAAAPEAAPATAPAASNPEVRSRAEADALPDGAIFIFKGRRFRKTGPGQAEPLP